MGTRISSQFWLSFFILEIPHFLSHTPNDTPGIFTVSCNYTEIPETRKTSS
nr:MAG TPA: hypothetical protein [Caudoviricetes sp.]